MIAVLSIISVVFLGVGVGINASNAPYLLSGYNTLSNKEREHFDLHSFLKFFKKAHVFLSMTTFFVGLFLWYVFPGDAAVYWLVFYPLLFYGCLLWRSKIFYAAGHTKPFSLYVGMVVIGLSVVGIAGGLYFAQLPNQLLITPDHIEITGAYGATVDRKTTQIYWVDSLPKLRKRINGVATQSLKKGYFLTAARKKIKVLMAAPAGKFLVFHTKGDALLYYQLPPKDEAAVRTALKQAGWTQ